MRCILSSIYPNQETLIYPSRKSCIPQRLPPQLQIIKQESPNLPIWNSSWQEQLSTRSLQNHKRETSQPWPEVCKSLLRPWYETPIKQDIELNLKNKTTYRTTLTIPMNKHHRPLLSSSRFKRYQFLNIHLTLHEITTFPISNIFSTYIEIFSWCELFHSLLDFAKERGEVFWVKN